MKGNTIYWILGALVLFYFLSKQSASNLAAQQAASAANQNEFYASTAAGIIESF